MFWTTTAKENKKHSAFRLTVERCYRHLCALIMWAYTDLMAMRKHLPHVNTQVFTWKRVCQVGLRTTWAEIEASPGEWANMPTATGRYLLFPSLLNYIGVELWWKPQVPWALEEERGFLSCLTRRLQHGSGPYWCSKVELYSTINKGHSLDKNEDKLGLSFFFFLSMKLYFWKAKCGQTFKTSYKKWTHFLDLF